MIKLTKSEAEKEIIKAINFAEASGFKIVVASDEEGNNWNSINSDNVRYDGTKSNYIALGVWENIDENEIFDDGQDF